MIIHLLDVLAIAVKAYLYLGGCAFLGLMFLWPINDQPTSKGQWATWIVLCVLLFILVFTNWITFSL